MTPFAELLTECIRIKEDEKMLADNRTKMSDRRVKELIAESEEQLFRARAVANQSPVWDDPDGPERREAAGKWAESINGRISSLLHMLAEREVAGFSGLKRGTV